MKPWRTTIAVLALLIVITVNAQTDPHNWKVGDMITFTDAAAVTPPAYAIPPGTPGFPDGLFFGTMFEGVTNYKYTHQAVYTGNDSFLGADGIGGVYVTSKEFMLSRVIGEPIISRFNVYSIVPPWFPRCLANMLRHVIIDRWIDKGMESLGQPYDVGIDGRSFLLGNNAKYCSELLWQSFKDAWGVELSAPVPAGALNYAAWTFILTPLGVQPEQGIITLEGLVKSRFFEIVSQPVDPDGC